MQTGLNKLVEWCDLNGFKISMKKKTVVILFTHRRDHIDGILRIIMAIFYYKIVHVVQNNEKNTRDNQKIKEKCNKRKHIN